MTQPSRPERVADVLRAEVAELLAREVKDPGIGFVTVTRVTVTADLQLARIYYSALGDLPARRATARALARAGPYLRRQIARRVRLRRVPQLEFVYDETIDQQDRLERLLQELHAGDAAHLAAAPTDEKEHDDEGT